MKKLILTCQRLLILQRAGRNGFHKILTILKNMKILHAILLDCGQPLMNTLQEDDFKLYKDELM